MASSNRKIEEQVEYRDGKLYWLNPRKKSLIGTECGHLTERGYRIMKAENKTVPVHHVVWFLHYGVWPVKGLDIDHINQNKQDNRIENLRQVTRSVNSFNNKAKNVSKNGKGWRARAGQKYIGTFADREVAEKAIKDYKQIFHGVTYG